MSSAWGAAIGGATNLAGNLIQNASNKNEARRQREYNDRNWQRDRVFNDYDWNRQNEYNQQMWEQQNKYNSPIEQMARLKEAGLNPALMYGKGTVGNSGAISTPGMKPQSVQGYNRPQMESITRGLDVFGQYQQFKQMDASTNKIKAETDAINEATGLKSLDAQLKVLALTRGKLNYDQDYSFGKYNLEALGMENQQKRNELKNSVEIEALKLQDKQNSSSILQRKKDNYLDGIMEGDSFIIRQLFDKVPGFKDTFLEASSQFVDKAPALSYVGLIKAFLNSLKSK